MYTQQTSDYTKTTSPPNLEIDFLLDSGATLHILNNDTWNEIWDYHKLQLKACLFVILEANNSELQSNDTVKLTLYPDVTENRTLRKTNFARTLLLSNTKFNILGTPFPENFVESIKCLSHKVEIKHKYETKFLRFYESSAKLPQYYSQLFFVIGNHSLFINPLNTES